MAPGATYDSDARSAVPECHPRQVIMALHQGLQAQAIQLVLRQTSQHSVSILRLSVRLDWPSLLDIAELFTDAMTNSKFWGPYFSLDVRPAGWRSCDDNYSRSKCICKVFIGTDDSFSSSLLTISLKGSTDQRRRLIVIDGLDDCDGPGKNAQTEILDPLLFASPQRDGFPLSLQIWLQGRF